MDIFLSFFISARMLHSHCQNEIPFSVLWKKCWIILWSHFIYLYNQSLADISYGNESFLLLSPHNMFRLLLFWYFLLFFFSIGFFSMLFASSLHSNHFSLEIKKVTSFALNTLSVCVFLFEHHVKWFIWTNKWKSVFTKCFIPLAGFTTFIAIESTGLLSQADLIFDMYLTVVCSHFTRC